MKRDQALHERGLIRLRPYKALSGAEIPVVTICAPVIPGLKDPELESILESVAESDAESAQYAILRQRHELNEIYLQ